MKALIPALAAAAIAVGAATTASADRPICLQNILIDHTSVKDSQTLLFHMKNGDVFQNKLRSACPGLNFHGFVMDIRGGIGDVCSNQQTISVLVTHEVCALGEFTPYKAPPKAPAKS